MCINLHKLIDQEKVVKFIWMDNSGENKKFVEYAENSDWKLNLVWEFTARDTPQQNGLVEVEFAIIIGRTRAMYNVSNMPLNVRTWLANEVLMHSTALGNLQVDKGQTKSRNELIGLPNPIWANPALIRTFGEAGVVRQDKNGKLGDQGIAMVFVGYSKNHAADCY